MGFIGLVLRCLFGTIAGVLRLTPFVVNQLLDRKRSLPPYDPNKERDLGASLLAEHRDDVQKGDFIDVTIVNPKDSTKLHAVIDSGEKRVKGKRPIVMVHGFPELWISWIEQMIHFTELGHPVLALDMRGYGTSDKPSPEKLEPYDLFDCLAEDVRTAVKYATEEMTNGEEDARPLLMAHDWGANVCWSYAKQLRTVEAREIAGYISLAIPPPECFEANLGLKQLWASLYMIFFNMPWLPERFFLSGNAKMLAVMMKSTAKINIIPEWEIDIYRHNALQPGAMTAMLNYYRSVIQNAPKPDPVDVLGGKNGRRLDTPVLMIRGRGDDALLEDVFVGFDRYLSDANLVALDECSHLIQADRSDAVNDETGKFLVKIEK